MTHDLAIIGAGNMAEAIARGIIGTNVIDASRIIAADVSPARRELFAQALHIECVEDPAKIAGRAPTILLSVKPQQMRDVLGAIAPQIQRGALVISIAAGIATNLIDEFVGASACRVIRAMPNTPMLAGEGMVVLSPGPRAGAHDINAARKLFAPAATVIQLPEDKLDAVTALSGSGPAYFFYLVEQMIAAGIEMGLSPEDARTLAVRTGAGAGRMLATSNESPQELRRRVTSPGGTTEAAISHMQQHHLDQIVIDAVKAAQRRGQQLGRSNA